MIQQIFHLIKKEALIEYRNKYAINGMLLYIIGACYICYIGFRFKSNQVNAITWNTLFWIIILFTALSAIAKSFVQEREGRLLYQYTLVNAESIILSKIIYNCIILNILAFTGFGFYCLVMGNPVVDLGSYCITIFLGCLGLASTLTLVASIAAKSGNASTLMAVLSFPLVIPILLLILKISKNALDGLDRSLNFDEILMLLAIDAIVVVLSVILFPFLWKS